MKTAEEFTAACQASARTILPTARIPVEYGSLPRGACPASCPKLEKNTFVEDLTLSELLRAFDLAVELYFENKSKSSALEMQKNMAMDEDDLKDAIMKTSIIFESISRSSVLVKLTLFNVLLEMIVLEGFLSSTPTYWSFTTFRAIHDDAPGCASPGLAKNKSLSFLVEYTKVSTF
jgi:hypothetical protein